MKVVDQVVNHFGGPSATARVMQLDRQLVHSWKKRGYIPPKYAFVVQDLTKGKVTAQEVIDEANERMPRAAKVVREVA